MMDKDKEGGLVIALDEEVPTILSFGDKIVKVYLLRLKSGKQRARFVSDRDIKIFGPSRVRKGYTGDINLD